MSPKNYWATKTPEERAAIAKKAKDTLRRRIERERQEEEEYRKKALDLKFQISEFSQKLSSLEKMELAHPIAMHLTGKKLLWEMEIVAASVPYVQATGVYFLVSKRKVVYVGQSTNIFSRIQDHLKGKEFESFAYIPCERDMLDKIESIYIHMLRPPLNGEIHGAKIAPLSFEELLAYQIKTPWQSS